MCIRDRYCFLTLASLLRSPRFPSPSSAVLLPVIPTPSTFVFPTSTYFRLSIPSPVTSVFSLPLPCLLFLPNFRSPTYFSPLPTSLYFLFPHTSFTSALVYG